ncbi:MAG TPA: hypothetical protein VGL02_22285 [Streptomyces sp.]
MTDYLGWVRDGKIVDARYAIGDGVHARGVVYAYTDRPTLKIRLADGSTVSWVADLCQPTRGDDVVDFIRRMRPARREYSIQQPIRPGTARRLGIRPPRPDMRRRRLPPSQRAHLSSCAYPSGVGFCSCP